MSDRIISERDDSSSNEMPASERRNLILNGAKALLGSVAVITAAGGEFIQQSGGSDMPNVLTGALALGGIIAISDGWDKINKVAKKGVIK